MDEYNTLKTDDRIEIEEEAYAGDFLPKIVPLLDGQVNSPNRILYIEVIRNALGNLLKDQMKFSWGDDLDLVADQRAQFHSLLPLVTMSEIDQVPGNISFYALSKYRANAFKYFFNMISCWLTPGKRVDVVLLYAVDFRLPEISDEVYTLCELVVRVDSQKELDEILKNFLIIQSELCLGIPSAHYSQRILETKGLSVDFKTAIIQEYITRLIDRLPSEFDQELITEMQHVLVMSSEEFKNIRECRHLSRIISYLYLFRKAVHDSSMRLPSKRHLSLKLFRARLNSDKDPKTVLSVVLGMNFFGDKEIFEKTHLLKAIKSYIPNVKLVDDSIIYNRRRSENICTLYLELEKENEEDFTGEEINLLREKLPYDLKDRIEHLLHPIFMPRNEEEVIRNILSLSSQIQYLRDIPQMFISFDEQTAIDLYFTVILVRVYKPEYPSIYDLFKATPTFLEYIHDRTQFAGNLRRKFKKEATVFRVKLAKEPFLRANHSIDLNKARQTVVAEISRIVGDIRDFNGGMITKQHEVFCQFRSLLQNEQDLMPAGSKISFNELLAENFFYSLTPVIMRNVLEPEILRDLFLMLIEGLNRPYVESLHHHLAIRQEGDLCLVMVQADGRTIKDELKSAIAKLHLHSSQLAHTYVTANDHKYLGYVYRSDDIQKQRAFCTAIKDQLAAWELKLASSRLR